MKFVMRIKASAKTVLITAGHGVTTQNASKQHLHAYIHILSLENKYLETYNHNLQQKRATTMHKYMASYRGVNSMKRHAENSGNHVNL